MAGTTERNYVTASEVGAYVYCPESWYLARRGQPRADAAAERLRLGGDAHRRIGQATDSLVAAEAARRGLLVALILVGIAVLLLAFDIGVFAPWS